MLAAFVRLLQQLCHIILNCIAPDFITRGAEVQIIGHDLLVQTAVFLQELLADVFLEDMLSIIEFSDDSIRGLDLVPPRIGCLRRTWEDAEEENLHLGFLLPEFLDNGFDPSSDLLGRVSVVRADHDDGNLGLDRFEFFAFRDAPEDVAGLIAADPKVHSLQRGEVFGPYLLAIPFPTLGYRVTNEDHIGIALRNDLEKLFVSPVIAVDEFGGRVVLVLCGCWCIEAQRQKCGSKQEAREHDFLQVRDSECRACRHQLRWEGRA
jgi:hypothetical protein